MLRTTRVPARTAVRAVALCGAGLLACQQARFTVDQALLEESRHIPPELGEHHCLDECLHNPAFLAETRTHFTRAQPILAAMGKRIVFCGGPGAGQAAKICNNMILGATMSAVCEGFALVEKLGLSQQTLFDICSESSAQSWAMTSYCPVPGPVPA